jgi:hypothetical protein
LLKLPGIFPAGTLSGVDTDFFAFVRSQSCQYFVVFSYINTSSFAKKLFRVPLA